MRTAAQYSVKYTVQGIGQIATDHQLLCRLSYSPPLSCTKQVMIRLSYCCDVPLRFSLSLCVGAAGQC